MCDPHRLDEDLVTDFDWIQEVTILLSYNSETDTVVIDRGKLGRTLVAAILEKALEDMACADDLAAELDED